MNKKSPAIKEQKYFDRNDHLIISDWEKRERELDTWYALVRKAGRGKKQK